MSEDVVDVAVVGAGPAGLMAALKSALLFHSCVVLDKGPRTGRAFHVPEMANIPGYPEGVSGRRILDDLRRQVDHVAAKTGRHLVHFEDRTEVTQLVRRDDGTFTLRGHRVIGRDGVGEDVEVHARVVILATGVVDRQPYVTPESRNITGILPYANKGLADYCLLCDGHTIQGKRVAVLGIDEQAVGIATTLRDHFGAADVTLVMCVACATSDTDHAAGAHEGVFEGARREGLSVVDKVVTGLAGLREDRLSLTFEDGTREEFDRAWVSLGWYKLNNALAVQAGAALDAQGYVRTTEDCEVVGEDGDVVAGLFCVGDLRSETWNQIPIAMGDAETAVVHAYAFRLD